MAVTSTGSEATFVDPRLNRLVDTDGFAVVDFAPAETIASLREAYERLDSGIDRGYYPSFMSPHEGYKAETSRTVTEALWPDLGALLLEYVPLLGVFMVKHPGPDTEVVPHQDWIVADESDRPTINVWLPLTPIDETTGIMKVLPGSHAWLNGLRGSPAFPTAWEDDWERVRDELMVPVDIGLGQALVYDIRLLHGTGPNLSEQTRVVASLYAIPDGADAVHYHRTPDGTVSGYKVPADFCTTFAIGEVPKGERFVTIEDYAVTPLGFEQLAEMSKRRSPIES